MFLHSTSHALLHRPSYPSRRLLGKERSVAVSYGANFQTLRNMAPDDLARIESAEDAEGVALTWAHENDLASRDFRAFAKEWFMDTPVDRHVRINLRAALRSFSSVCKHYESEWGKMQICSLA